MQWVAFLLDHLLVRVAVTGLAAVNTLSHAYAELSGDAALRSPRSRCYSSRRIA